MFRPIELPKPSRKFVLTICLISLLIITDEKLRFLTSASLDVEVLSSSSDDCIIFDDITAI